MIIIFDHSTNLFELKLQSWISRINFVASNRKNRYNFITVIDKEEVKDSIIVVARQIFSRFGFRKTTMDEIAQAAQKISLSSNDLVSAMDTVSAVVEENTAATEEMAANSNELTQSIEAIASVSEENSAAVEQVSASTEEVSAQVEEVSASAASMLEMAANLQQIVSMFKLK